MQTGVFRVRPDWNLPASGKPDVARSSQLTLQEDDVAPGQVAEDGHEGDDGEQGEEQDHQPARLAPPPLGRRLHHRPPPPGQQGLERTVRIYGSNQELSGKDTFGH